MYIYIYIYTYIYIYILHPSGGGSPNLPTNITPTNIARLKLSGQPSEIHNVSREIGRHLSNTTDLSNT